MLRVKLIKKLLMMLSSKIPIFVLLTFLLYFPQQQDAKKIEFNGEIWALLVAGSAGYTNYRHQADICHAYNILRHNGVKEENIITMMYDDVAFNPENPNPGILINKPNGTDVYKTVKKDYVGPDVNPTNFLNILKGDAKAMKGIGTGRVINSNQNDFIFVNFVDHGGPGVLFFVDSMLHAATLINELKVLKRMRKYKMMALYIEACYAGSMFEEILSDTMNIFVMSAADPYESSLACYYDEKLQTYLGDVFSVNWMEEAERENLSNSSLNHLFEKVRTLTDNSSHVEEYGDLDIGSTIVTRFLGDRSAYLKSVRQKPDLTVKSLKTQMNEMSKKIKNKVRKQLSKTTNVTENDVTEYPDELADNADHGNETKQHNDTVFFENKKIIFNFTSGPFVHPSLESGIVSQVNATLDILKRRASSEQNKSRAAEMNQQIDYILQARQYADRVISKVILNFTNGDLKKSEELLTRRKSVTEENMYCVMDLTTFFDEYCLDVALNTYVRPYIQVFINACSASWTDHVTPLIEGIKYACKNVKTPPAHIV